MFFFYLLLFLKSIISNEFKWLCSYKKWAGPQLAANLRRCPVYAANLLGIHTWKACVGRNLELLQTSSQNRREFIISNISNTRKKSTFRNIIQELLNRLERKKKKTWEIISCVDPNRNYLTSPNIFLYLWAYFSKLFLFCLFWWDITP